MVRKTVLLLILIFTFFSFSAVSAYSSKNIEVLDIASNKIIKTIPVNSTVQLESEKFIKAIDNIVKKFDPIPDKGYMIKIPLEPSVQLENKWVNSLIDEVIIIIPEDEEAYLLTFDDENNTHFFTFKSSIDKLLTALDLSI